jgi:hypothetical protein
MARVRPALRWVAAALAAAALAGGCGNPEVALAVPERQDGQVMLDEAGVLDAAVADRLAAVAADTGVDVVALAFEDPQASLGQADRGGRLLLDAWGADVVVVAVARPGDFASSDEQARRRYFGVFATDRFAVPRGLRERIVEEAVPPLAARNDWPGAFTAAADILADELGG